MHARQWTQVFSLTRAMIGSRSSSRLGEEAQHLGGGGRRLGHRVRDVLRRLARAGQEHAGGGRLDRPQLRVGLAVEAVACRRPRRASGPAARLPWPRHDGVGQDDHVGLDRHRPAGQRVGPADDELAVLAAVDAADAAADVLRAVGLDGAADELLVALAGRPGCPCRRRPPARRAPCACRAWRAWRCTCSRSSSSRSCPSSRRGCRSTG